MLQAVPENYNQPLTRWGHSWRTFLCLVISGVAWASVVARQWEDFQAWFWLDLGVGLASFVLVSFRRRWPVPVAAILSLTGLVSMTAAGPATLAVVSLATRRKLPSIILVSLLSIVCGQAYTHYQPAYSSEDPAWLSFAFLLLMTIAVAVFGMYIGSRRELVWTLRERAHQAESEQELRVSQARSGERERIAREMHDVLAHRISLVTMHAGALAYRTDLPPEQIRETAKLIQEKAHEALTDLRQVLGVLRDDGIGDRPQPTLCDLPALIEEAAGSGMRIDFASEIEDGTPPSDQIGRTIYRIVQEALTNARKHAVGSHVTVRIVGDEESGVTVTIRNGIRVGSLGMPTTPGAGLGLVGVRERAALAGGTLEVSRTADTFTLRCWLPWT
ncbi:histidine kinase [Nocardioides marmoriginsengisoli]|uniref:histidine kinase n=1 Tax=Nocardioides marmoriginsengisoli TaxID=661483 RepID=A0A3N0CJF4_9ACTN|nr:histidine kinase [Nocardioides marmoriginsengisoli]RNL63146.1 histidine kinase [Nocardioides marmoriginsengisoli]